MNSLRKNIISNDLIREGSISLDYNSYYISYYSQLYPQKYQVNTFTEISGIIDESVYQFNEKDYMYYNTYSYMVPYSLIISNLGDKSGKFLYNSYLLYYNSVDRLYQLSYVIQEGNGLYYDNKSYMMTFNIDHTSIKEVNNRIYMNINSIPYSSNKSFGISLIDPNYLEIDNGQVSIIKSTQQKTISLSNNIKNIYFSLQSIYNQYKFYLDYKNSDLSFSEKSSSSDELLKNYSYSIITPKIYFIDDFYYINNIIQKKDNDITDYYKGKYLVPVSNNRIIYTKNLDTLKICISNGKSLTIPVTYLYTNYEDDNNKFYTRNYIENYFIKYNDNNIGRIIDLEEDNEPVFGTALSGDYYSINRVQVLNKKINDPLFKQYGLSLNLGLKNNYTTTKSNNSINCTYYLYGVDLPIKIIYDSRNIQQCTVNSSPLNSDSEYVFYLSNNDDISITQEKYLNLKMNGLIWTPKSPYIYLGYTIYDTQELIEWTDEKNKKHISEKYNKKYYPIWQHQISIRYVNGNISISDLVEDYPEIGSQGYYIDSGNYKAIRTINLFKVNSISSREYKLIKQNDIISI